MVKITLILLIGAMAQGVDVSDGDFRKVGFAGPPKAELISVEGLRLKDEIITHRFNGESWVAEKECPTTVAFENSDRKIYYRFCADAIEELLSTMEKSAHYQSHVGLREKLIHRSAFEAVTVLSSGKIVISSGESSVVFELSQ